MAENWFEEGTKREGKPSKGLREKVGERGELLEQRKRRKRKK